MTFLDPLHRLGAGPGLEHVEILGHHELFAQRLAQVVIVVDKQDLLQVAMVTGPPDVCCIDMRGSMTSHKLL
jgi:hypothetical protein